MTMSENLLARLAKLDSCIVSDALDALEISGVALELTALSVRRRLVGTVVTVQLGVADGRRVDRHLCTAAVEAAGPGNVIAIAHGARTDVGSWGGILSAGAAFRGIEGVIIDGACRDVDEAIDLALPIYGRSGISITARGRAIEYAWNVPITICGAAVSPADYVIADSSGVAFIPQAYAEEVVDRAEAFARREQFMIEEIRSGTAISTVMGNVYESMLTE
jgi:4-hydroxy-4-methyl-2-oxoglutarate aldolase